MKPSAIVLLGSRIFSSKLRFVVFCADMAEVGAKFRALAIDAMAACAHTAHFDGCAERVGRGEGLEEQIFPMGGITRRCGDFGAVEIFAEPADELFVRIEAPEEIAHRFAGPGDGFGDDVFAHGIRKVAAAHFVEEGHGAACGGQQTGDGRVGLGCVFFRGMNRVDSGGICSARLR